MMTANSGAHRLRRAVTTPLLATLLLLASTFAAQVAHAGIILGDTVNVAVYAPSRSELCFLCGGTTQVNVAEGSGDAVEPYLAGGNWFEVDIDPTNISITFNRDIAWQSGDFIGLVISDIDWLEGAVRSIPGASLVASGANGSLPALSMQFNERLQHTDSTVELNWQGLTIAAGTRFEISLQAMTMPPAQGQMPPVDVPEPGPLLLLAALLALAMGRRMSLVRRLTAGN